MKTNPLLDIEFMNNLIISNEREVYARITVLNQQENPIEYIEGQVTDGSITIDGKSIVRRTCNLTMTANDINIEEFYWGLKNKFTLEIGLKNEINKNYPEIIWFKMGLFVITQFNTTQTTNKWTIKISGKDKMCLLNGDISGNLFSETDFGTEEYHDLENDTVTFTDVPIKTIIFNIVNVFGGELPQNIIINDLEDSGLILLEYMNEEPAYLYRDIDGNEYKNIVLDGTIECYYPFQQILTPEQYSLIPDDYQFLKAVYRHNDEFNDYRYDGSMPEELWDRYYEDQTGKWFLGRIEDKYAIIYDNLLENLEFNPEPSIIRFPIIEYDRNGQIISKKPSEYFYILSKFETGDVPGYFYTDLTYAYGEKELIGKAGESLTSILNKIKDMLSNFEYFYDINGKFVFQKKTDYITTAWNSIDNNDVELYKDSNLDRGEIMFSFVDSKLVTSFQNTPKITDLKNDYTVWGSYKLNETEIPLHMRYAIDVKPSSYCPIRPLKEEINIVIKQGEKILSDTTTYKYYDAPEIEPYNDRYLQRLEMGETKNGFSVSQITVPTKEGYTQTTTIYPYFATESYCIEKQIEYTYASFVLHPETGELILLSDKEKAFSYQEVYVNFHDYLKATEGEEIFNLFATEVIVRPPVDWRELIYQMALDYRKCHTLDNFLHYLSEANPQYPSGYTGYEQYYIDLEGFWRTLYDPNPKVDYKQIPFNEIKKTSPFLTDTNPDNDKYDNIYIYNGYRRLTFMDANEFLLPTDLYYKHYTPDYYADKPDAIYPFITGDDCSLKLGQTYYVNKDGTMKAHQANANNDSQYEEINRHDLNNIFIRNMQNFSVISKDDIKEDYQYFTTFDRLIEENISRQKYFTVPLYPAQSYGPENFFKFVDVAFDQLTEQDEWYSLREFFVKTKDYERLEDIIKSDPIFKNMYYKSDLSILEQYSKQVQNKLDKIILSEYSDNNRNKYLTDFMNIIYDYITTMIKYNFTDLNNGFNFELSEIIINHQLSISDKVQAFIDNNYEFVQPEFSRLDSILKSLVEKIDDTVNRYGKLLEDNCTNKLVIIKRIYEQVIDTLDDIANKYSEVKAIKNISEEIQSCNTLNEIDAILSNYESTFSKKDESQLQVNSQVELTLQNIKRIRTIIKDAAEMDIPVIKQDIDFFIGKPVTLMQQFIDIAYQTNKDSGGLILTLSLVDYENLYKFISTIVASFSRLIGLFSRLTTPSQDDFVINDKDEIISLISFNRRNGLLTPILQNLYNILNMSGNTQYSYLYDYSEDIKNYQEFIATPKLDNFGNITDEFTYEKINYYIGSFNYNQEPDVGNFWCYDVYNTPQLLTFWFDFLDPNQNDLSRVSVPAIGTRTKVITDKNVKAINYTQIPQVIFKRPTDDYEIKSGYTYININSNTEGFFRTSSRGKSAKERTEELLYNHSYCAENVTIATVPIYHLEPNYHIYIRDDKSNIDGEYIINKLTIPLSFKKTMNITATKAAPYLN